MTRRGHSLHSIYSSRARLVIQAPQAWVALAGHRGQLVRAAGGGAARRILAIRAVLIEPRADPRGAPPRRKPGRGVPVDPVGAAGVAVVVSVGEGVLAYSGDQRPVTEPRPVPGPGLEVAGPDQGLLPAGLTVRGGGFQARGRGGSLREFSSANSWSWSAVAAARSRAYPTRAASADDSVVRPTGPVFPSAWMLTTGPAGTSDGRSAKADRCRG